MLSIELDIYSGRPNPEWKLTPKEEQDLVDRILANPSLMRPIDADTGGLGYRGYIVRALSEDENAWSRSKLPSQFRIGGRNDDPEAAALWLLDSSEKPDSEVDDYLREYLHGSVHKSNPTALIEEEPSDTLAATVGCNRLLTSDREFSFWNAPAVITRNNAYNFAANNRTGTLAQPGRRSGRIYPGLLHWEISAAAVRDGFGNGCFIIGPNLMTALFIAPGPGFLDFHWYRLCLNNHWCHKPGVAPARNTDNSGAWITDPRRANRGPYSVFAGFWYGRNPVNVR